MPTFEFRGKPVVIFDDHCDFCSDLACYAERRWPGTAQFIGFSSKDAKVFDTVLEDIQKGLVYVDESGGKKVGACAIQSFLAASVPKKMQWVIRLLWIPSVAQIVYRWVMKHRPLCLKFLKIIRGQRVEPSTYAVSTALFPRFLGVIYLMAFLSLLFQIKGLIGSNGISPAVEYLSFIKSKLGWKAFFQAPTLFWIGSSDAALMLGAWTGILLSILAILNRRTAPALAGLWMLYLSYVNATSDFLSFQWDQLLLEAGFLGVFMAPWKQPLFGKSPAYSFKSASLIRLSLLWLTFRVIFFAGVMKLRGGDASWINGAALSFHLETQPLPTPLAVFLSRFPSIFLKVLTYAALCVEIIGPFMLIMPRRLRMLGLYFLISEQLILMGIANNGFLNPLVLCLYTLFGDDQSLPKWIQLRFSASHASDKSTYRWPQGWILAVACLVFVGTVDQLPRLFNWTQAETVFAKGRDILRPLKSFNAYGLYGTVSPKRYELAIEGSYNQHEWTPYSFRFKPGDPDQPPPLAFFHQPRLDWHMWIAALSSSGDQPWVFRLSNQLMKGSKDVLRLFAANPFPDMPPKYIQIALYEYRLFRGNATQHKRAAWWQRVRVGTYVPAHSRNLTV